MTAHDLPAIQITDLTRSYAVGGEQVSALRGVNLKVSQGAFVALVGRSGSGKTTLLNMIGGLDQPTAGEPLRVASEPPHPQIAAAAGVRTSGGPSPSTS